ncbi:MAG: SpoIIE family protein phosphatase [Deinococcota bacterium]
MKQVEAQLLESQQFLEDAQSMGKLGGWSFDLVTQDLYWSKQIYDISEVSYDTELTVELAVSVYVDPAAIEAAMSHTITTHEPYDVELEIITLKGNHRWVRSIGKPIVEDGEVVKLVGTHQDISDMKQAELGLQVANDNLARLNMFSTFINQASTIDAVLEVVLNNFTATEDVMGCILYTHSNDQGDVETIEMVSNKSTGTNKLPIDIGAVFPLDNFPAVHLYFEDPSRATFIADVVTDTRLDENSRATNLQIGILAEALIALEHAGEIVALIVICWPEAHEFSDQEQAYLNALPALLAPVVANRRLLGSLEQTVSERTQELQTQLTETIRFKTLIETTSDIVGYADMESQIEYINPAGLTFFGEEATTQLAKISDVYTPAAYERFEQEALPKLMETGIWQGETAFARLDGSEVPVSQVITVIRNQEGEPTGLGSVIRDISESKALETNLRQTNATLGQLSDLSQALNKVTSKQELLELVAQLAADNAASDMVLFDVNNQLMTNGQPESISLAASLSPNNIARDNMPVGTIFSLQDYGMTQIWLNNPQDLVIIEDIRQDPRVDAKTLELAHELDIGAEIVVPLLQNDQWLAVLIFNWRTPQQFSKIDVQLYDALKSLVPPALANLNIVADLEDLVEARSGELRTSNERLAILNDVTRKLNLATNYDELVDVVLEVLPDTTVGGLMRTITAQADKNIITAIELVSNRSAGVRTIPAEVGSIFPIDTYPMVDICLADSNDATFMEDIHQDARVDNNTRELYQQLGIGSQVFVSLRQAGHTYAMLNLSWPDAMTFSADQRAYIEALPGILSPIVTGLQSLDDLAISNKRLANLNEVSTQLNQVQTIDELLEIITKPLNVSGGNLAASANYPQYDDQHQLVSVQLTSLYLEGELTVPIDVGTVFPLEQFPSINLFLDPSKQLTVIEDIANDARLDDINRTFLLQIGLESEVLLTLRQADKVVALLGIYWSVPRTFSEDERAYLNALPTLLTPVVANLQSLEGLARANDRLARLNKVSSALKAAETIDGVLEIILEPLSEEAVATMSRPVYDDEGRVTALEIIGIHSRTSKRFDAEIGAVYPVEDYATINWYLEDADRVKLISDVSQEPRFDDNLRAVQARLGIGAQAYITLKQADNILAFVSVIWEQAHEFSEDEQAYFNALPALLSPVVANRHALDNLEQANQHLALVNSVSERLKNASTADELLDTILAPLNGDLVSGLFDIIDQPPTQPDEPSTASAIQLISNRNKGRYAIGIRPGAVFKLNIYPSINLWLAEYNKATFVQDVLVSNRIDNNLQVIYGQLGIQATAHVTLYQGGKVIAMLGFYWSRARNFSSSERAYLNALPAMLAPVVANMKSLASLAQSNTRLATLNHVSNALKAAETSNTMLDALLEPLPDSTVASLFYADGTNNRHQVTTTRLVNQRSKGSFKAMPLGSNIEVADHPLAQMWLSNPESISIVEDTQAPGVASASARADFAEYNIKKLVSVPLLQSNEWIGFLILTWNHNYTFSEDELAYLNALPTILAPPLANRRMVETLEETVAKRSEELARSRQLLRATIDNAPLIVSVKDTDFRYILANNNINKLIEGSTPKDIIGKDDFELLPLQIAEEIRETDTYVRDNKVVHTYEAIRTNNLIYYVNKFPLLDENGDIFAIGLIANDITEQRRKDKEMQSYRDQLSQAEAELQITQRIQELLLPADDELAAIRDLDIASYMRPAEQVGGDYYDIMQLGDTVRFGIGDVTGHGLESGLLMLMTQTAVRTLLSSGEHDPKRIINVLNKTVFDNLERMQVDKSLTLSLLDYERGQLRLSGQHEYVLVIREGGQVETIDTMDLGMPLGLEADISQFIAEKTLELNPGEGVVLFTDGITEAENNSREQFGLTRLTGLIAANWHQPAQAITDVITKAVYDYVDDHIIYDDITLIVFKRPVEDDVSVLAKATQPKTAQRQPTHIVGK